jgi:hypothetical protein
MEFWDVPFALAGVAFAAVLKGFVLGGYHVLWEGAPLAFVAARRMMLPELDRPLPAPGSISIGRRIGAYALMVLGGFVAMIAGVAFYVGATDENHPQTLWPALAVAGVGGLVAALGLRRIT